MDLEKWSEGLGDWRMGGKPLHGRGLKFPLRASVLSLTGESGGVITPHLPSPIPHSQGPPQGMSPR